jgi:hypothetical protein
MGRLVLILLLALLPGIAQAQEAGNFLTELLGGILGTPEILTPIIVYLLALIPGPVRGIARAIINWLLERARNELEKRKQQAAQEAVLAAEQRKSNMLKRNSGDMSQSERSNLNAAAKNFAVRHAMEAAGMSEDEASLLVEAQVARAKQATGASDKRLDELEGLLGKGY